jgi:hypothetical protein
MQSRKIGMILKITTLNLDAVSKVACIAQTRNDIGFNR